jgi:hypothetical protein
MELETIEVDSCVRGHHVYNRIWTTTLGEELQCVTEDSNMIPMINDPYAVGVMKRDDTSLGKYQLPARGGVIDCIITGSRRFSAFTAPSSTTNVVIQVN